MGQGTWHKLWKFMHQKSCLLVSCPAASHGFQQHHTIPVGSVTFSKEFISTSSTQKAGILEKF